MRVVVVLPGGGATGAYQAGALQAMEDLGIQPYGLVGVSVGALNAVHYAIYQDSVRLCALWSSLDASKVFRGSESRLRILWRFLRGNVSAFDTEPLRETLTEALASAHSLNPLPCRFGAVNYATDVFEVWGFIPGALETVERLMASSAIPLAFPPVKIGTQYYYDGGIKNNNPLSLALDWEPDAVVILDPHAAEMRPAGAPTSILRIAKRIMSSFMREAIRSDQSEFLSVNTLAAWTEGHCGEPHPLYKHFDFYLVQPKRDLGGALDFSRPEELMTEGYADAYHALIPLAERIKNELL